MESNSIPVRECNLLVWGPIYITLNLEKNNSSESSTNLEQESNLAEKKAETNEENLVIQSSLKKGSLDEKSENSLIKTTNSKKSKSVNILSPSPPASTKNTTNPENSKKITYIYNLIDHGMDCECIDLKGELLIRSALPTYRKISQGIEYEQITTNQVKIIITSRVLDNYQEIFQGFTLPKATFRIWIMGYKFRSQLKF